MKTAFPFTANDNSNKTKLHGEIRPDGIARPRFHPEGPKHVSSTGRGKHCAQAHPLHNSKHNANWPALEREAWRTQFEAGLHRKCHVSIGSEVRLLQRGEVPEARRERLGGLDHLHNLILHVPRAEVPAKLYQNCQTEESGDENDHTVHGQRHRVPNSITVFEAMTVSWVMGAEIVTRLHERTGELLLLVVKHASRLKVNGNHRLPDN